MKYDVIGFARSELEKYLSVLKIKADSKLCLFHELGLIDEIGGISEAIEALNRMIEENKGGCDGDSCKI